jgi:hypothetical protein
MFSQGLLLLVFETQKHDRYRRPFIPPSTTTITINSLEDTMTEHDAAACGCILPYLSLRETEIIHTSR